MTAFDVLLTGDILGAVVGAYTDLIGFWFYVIGLIIIEVMVYYRTTSLPTVSIIGLLAGSAMVTTGLFPAEAAGVVYIILALSVAGMLYSTFGPKE